MFERDYMIWSDDPYYTQDIDEYKEMMEEEMPGELDGYSDEQIYERMAYQLAEDLDCERSNLNMILDDPIIVFVDLGLWDGRRHGYSQIPSGNISDCLQAHCSSMSYNTFRVTKEGEFCQDESHHDGTNHYTYRTLRDDLTEDEKDEFLEDLENGDVTEEEALKKTMPLGPAIAKIYGWEMVPETATAK